VLQGFTLTSGAAGYTYTYVQLGHTIQKTVLSHGGGVYGGYLGSGGVVSSCVLSGNTATDNGGGADNVTLLGCQLTANSAANGGGAADCTMNDCILTGNSAIPIPSSSPLEKPSGGAGGGVYGGTAVNCVIAGNNASLGGGACAPQLIDCTIVNNTAGFDGGVSPPASGPGGLLPYCLTNCVVYFNVANTNNNYDSSSLYVFDHCCTVPLPNGLGNIANVPTFVDFYGGDYHLASDSPVINSGNNAAAMTDLDLDGNPRIAGRTVDMGAYEYQTPSSVLSYAWAQQYGLPTDGSVDFVDSDGTGMDNWQKWVAGLNPTDPTSVLAMSSAQPANSLNRVAVTWQSVSTRNYFLLRSTNLALPEGFSVVQSNIAGQAGATTYIDATATNGGPYFYRVGVQW